MDSDWQGLATKWTGMLRFSIPTTHTHTHNALRPSFLGVSFQSCCKRKGTWGASTGYKSVQFSEIFGSYFELRIHRCQAGLSDFTNYASQGPELPRQPLFGGEALQGDVLEWKAVSDEMQVLH